MSLHLLGQRIVPHHSLMDRWMGGWLDISSVWWREYRILYKYRVKCDELIRFLNPLKPVPRKEILPIFMIPSWSPLQRDKWSMIWAFICKPIYYNHEELIKWLKEELHSPLYPFPTQNSLAFHPWVGPRGGILTEEGETIPLNLSKNWIVVMRF